MCGLLLGLGRPGNFKEGKTMYLKGPEGLDMEEQTQRANAECGSLEGARTLKCNYQEWLRIWGKRPAGLPSSWKRPSPGKAMTFELM
jgi:hypothetical protein